jgi:hypothetical protein
MPGFIVQMPARRETAGDAWEVGRRFPLAGTPGADATTGTDGAG